MNPKEPQDLSSINGLKARQFALNETKVEGGVESSVEDSDF
jgi:hypothetical protein